MKDCERGMRGGGGALGLWGGLFAPHAFSDGEIFRAKEAFEVGPFLGGTRGEGDAFEAGIGVEEFLHGGEVGELIGGEVEGGAGGEDACDCLDKGGLHEAAAPVAVFGPRIGEEDRGRAEEALGEQGEALEGIPLEEAQILEAGASCGDIDMDDASGFEFESEVLSGGVGLGASEEEASHSATDIGLDGLGEVEPGGPVDGGILLGGRARDYAAGGEGGIGRSDEVFLCSAGASHGGLRVRGESLKG